MQIAFFDTECYPNYWLLKFRPQGGAVQSFELRSGERLHVTVVEQICQLLNSHTVVSFNGIKYDVPMLAAALIDGYSCEQLFWLSTQLIKEGVKHWELGIARWEPADHIDIIETLPGAGSQKMYAGRIHYKTMRDLPYDPLSYLSEAQIAEVADYCENDLGQLEAEFDALSEQLKIREDMGNRYGIDLRSKSDAQAAEAILKHLCEKATGTRLYKAEVDWGLQFRYEPPAFLVFQTPQMQNAFELIKASVFALGSKGRVEMPPQLAGLEIRMGLSVYRMGIGGLHSSEKRAVWRSTDTHVIRDADVASYYPNLMINSGKFPKALGPAFTVALQGIVDERILDKSEQKRLEKAGLKYTAEWLAAFCANEGKKIFVNGSFGKTGSPWSILFAPEMMIQTTVTGQLSLLMLIEWHELNGIQVVSANTDGIVINCPRHLEKLSDQIIEEWERRTGLKMDRPFGEYAATYSRDINNYFAVKADGEVKRKGAYAKAGLVEKHSPDVEICGDAVADFLSKGIPLLYTIAWCRDIRKFVTVQKVTGGAVKLWGEGPRRGMKVKGMGARLLANGWRKATKDDDLSRYKRAGRDAARLCTHRALWIRDGLMATSESAHRLCFAPQMPEYLGKTIRWYYGTDSPGPMVYNKSGNQVPLSYGAHPCMTLPDKFPENIDYDWYLKTCEGMLVDIGYAEAGEDYEPLPIRVAEEAFDLTAQTA